MRKNELIIWDLGWYWLIRKKKTGRVASEVGFPAVDFHCTNFFALL